MHGKIPIQFKLNQKFSDLKIFQTLAQWIFAGLNKYDNHIIENLYIRSYNGMLSHIVTQIKNANFPKDHLISGLNEKVTRSLKWRKMVILSLKSLYNLTNLLFVGGRQKHNKANVCISIGKDKGARSK